jgi:hypothetical protein
MKLPILTIVSLLSLPSFATKPRDHEWTPKDFDEACWGECTVSGAQKCAPNSGIDGSKYKGKDYPQEHAFIANYSMYGMI